MKYLVSDEHKFVYFIVQKVACTSIKNTLLPLFDLDTTGYETTLEDGTRRLRIHRLFDQSGYQIRKKRLVAGLDDEYRDYFKFAFVRNPWDRLVSCYSDKLAEGGPGFNKLRYGNASFPIGMSFASFVEAVHRVPDRQANVHFRSQYKTICAPREHKPIMADFVGYFENLSDDFAGAAEKIGLEKLQFPHLMRSKSRGGRSYTEFYDERLKNLVYERYRTDIEIFGYSF